MLVLQNIFKMNIYTMYIFFNIPDIFFQRGHSCSISHFSLCCLLSVCTCLILFQASFCTIKSNVLEPNVLTTRSDLFNYQHFESTLSICNHGGRGCKIPPQKRIIVQLGTKLNTKLSLRHPPPPSPTTNQHYHPPAPQISYWLKVELHRVTPYVIL